MCQHGSRFLLKKIIILTILYRRNKLQAQQASAAQHTFKKAKEVVGVTRLAKA